MSPLAPYINDKANIRVKMTITISYNIKKGKTRKKYRWNKFAHENALACNINQLLKQTQNRNENETRFNSWLFDLFMRVINGF